MRLSSRAVWSYVASLACLGALVDAAPGLMQAVLVYPQAGEVYAPTSNMPIIFALQNASLAQYTYPVVSIDIFNGSDPQNSRSSYEQRLQPTNWTSDEPYFTYVLADQFRPRATGLLPFLFGGLLAR